MREAAFHKQNAAKWREFQDLLKAPKNADPDKLAELYIEVTDDLSFARTFYPESGTTKYLNTLGVAVHQEIYRNKREQKGRFVTFWKYELPLLMHKHRKELFYAFSIFLVSMTIGVVSAANDNQFVRIILGDSYVDMTESNIKAGDPMGVYKRDDSGDMFFMITFNNIRVSFYAFALGLLLSVGTAYILFSNGMMLGVFQHFFFERGLLLQSSLVIWIHGTLEISAIVIAGSAGLVMGNSILFPGTYTRTQSFSRGAREGMKMVVGLIPIFITAGFLESFVTRHTEMPVFLSGGIILTSLTFIIGYFVVWPAVLAKRAISETPAEIAPGSVAVAAS